MATARRSRASLLALAFLAHTALTTTALAATPSSTSAAPHPAARPTFLDTGWRATELARETFADATWRERWTVEGRSEFFLRDGRLVAHADEATLWWRQPLSANVFIELDAGVEPHADNNAANLNLILHARELDDRPYAYGRSGAYAEYHKIPNYIVTFTGGFQPGWSRLRRDPGFNLLHEEKSTRSEVGRSYRLRVLILEGRIRYWIDDRLIHEAVDPTPLPGGHFALRTWRSRVWWSNLRMSAIEKAP